MVRTFRTLLLASVLALVSTPAAAYPGPGPWSDVAPPDPDGGTAQLSLQAGTPHAYGITFDAGLAGISVDFRMARWAFLTVSADYAIPSSPSMALGPSFSLGPSGPRGPRFVLAPRVGLADYFEVSFPPSLVVGGHVLLDAPLDSVGAGRWWLGTSYRYSYNARDSLYSHYLFALGGMTFHVSRVVDLGYQIAGNVLFRTNTSHDCGCWIPFHAVTITFQLGLHLGPGVDRRVVIPKPGA